MGRLFGKVSLVTGASRGVGKGIALALGAEGATVYITGRTVEEGKAAVPLAGAIGSTADEVTRRGGKGVAVRCDHRDDAQVEAVFKQIAGEQGRLDILVNNAWRGYEGYADGRYPPPNAPFWERPVGYWDENMDGVRWAYVASALGVPMLVKQGSGLIVSISNPTPDPGNPAYNTAKVAVDRLTWEMAHLLRDHHVAAVSLYPGLVRTENVLMNAQWFDMSNSESPEFTGRAVAALATDSNIVQKTGKTFVVAKLAEEYNFDDVDGKRPKPA